MPRQQAKRKEVRKPAKAANAGATPKDARAEKSAARRTAILAAALDVFSAEGFAAARLDDVAEKAGVAKGTIYLHFKDKEMLFQELIRTAISPFVATIEAAPSNIPFRMVADTISTNFVNEVLGTKRKNIIRLVMTEGRRFPKIAEFYFHEVVERSMKAIRKLIKAGIERGELKSDALAIFPQLIIAPALVAIIWDDLFERFEPLDKQAMLKTHFDILFSATGSKES